MPHIRDKYTIFDGKACLAELMAITPSSAEYAKHMQDAFSHALQSAHDAGWKEIRARFMAKPNGSANVRERSYLTDTLLMVLFNYARQGNPALEQVSLVALGGYGRAELSPYSDIDLLFLYQPLARESAETFARWVLHLCWDLKLQVGHALRTVSDCIRLAREDHTIHTALLDARLITGNPDAFTLLQEQMEQKVIRGRESDFIHAKLEEREARHTGQGAMRYTVEPHLKEGKGGQRDLQSLWWIAKNSYGLQQTRELVQRGILTSREYRTYVMARSFFWQTRAYLHYLSGRAEERLTFDLQREISRAMGYENRPGMLGVERFMKRYFLMAKHVGDLTRVICAALEEEEITHSAFPLPDFLRRKRKLDGFPLQGQRLTLPAPDSLEKKPLDLIRLFQVAQTHGLDIHPETLKIIRRNLPLITREFRRDPEVNRLFMDILTAETNPAPTLRRMSEAGVLGRLIPDFGRIVGLMQFDMYHMLTVDEHTLHALDILHGIENGQYQEELPLASSLIHQVTLRRALYVALFLHDIAKGRGGDHSELGARIARRLCPRLGMRPDETDMVAWLVEHHLLFSHTAFKRDLGDPQTVIRFLEQVQSLERLKLLLILTAADIRAVSPQAWSGWKAVLLRELYNLTAARMGGTGDEEDRDSRMNAMRQAVSDHLQDWPEDERETYLHTPHISFWMGLSLDKHRRVAEMVRQTQKDQYPYNYHFTQEPSREITELMLCVLSQHGLFAQVSGACAAARISIVSAKIFTLPLGLTIILLDLQTPERRPLDTPEKQQRVIDSIRQRIGKEQRSAARIDKQTEARYSASSRAFDVTPSVLIDNHASREFTVLEVMARDRLGLLYTIAHILAKEGLLVATSHISTYGEKAVDVFYIRDIFGMKLTDERKRKRLRKKLLTALKAEEMQAGLPL